MLVDYSKICEERYIRDAESRQAHQSKSEKELIRELIKFLKIGLFFGLPTMILFIWLIKYEVEQSMKHMFDGAGYALSLALRRIDHGQF